MKIGIQTWGTEGDVRPFMALAGGLTRAGHEVTLMVTTAMGADFSELAGRLGFRLALVGRPRMDDAMARKLAARIFSDWNPVRQGRMVVENFFDPYLPEMSAAAARLCADNDLVIGHFFLYPLKIAAIKAGRPHVNVFTAPIVPSRCMAPPEIPRLGPWANALWWKMMDGMLNLFWMKPVARTYRAAGLPRPGSIMGEAWRSDRLNLVAVSPSLLPRPPDWPDHFHMCGFFNIPERAEPWRMPEAMARFLSAGPPPVYITFGSMIAGEADMGALARLLSAAADRAGCRAIIQAEWDAVSPAGRPGLSPNIFPVIRAPHQHVFPHCAAVVHHGGAGTTQSATRAGKPSVVVAHATDQPIWASLLRQRGIAPRMLTRRGLTPDRLARAIRSVLDSPGMGKRAEAMGERMRREDGVARAMELLASGGFTPGHPAEHRLINTN